MPDPGPAGGRPRAAPAGRAASLRRQLFVWLLPVAGVALFVSALADYLVARDAASQAHDQGLLDAATTYAERVQLSPQGVPRDMPAVAQRMLLAAPDDRVFFRLVDANGILAAGGAGLPDDLPDGSAEAPAFFDLGEGQQRLRGVAMRFEAGGRPFHLAVATTTRKRDRLMAEVLLGMAVPEALVFLMTGLLLAFGIRRGLAPIVPLRREIARRSHSDLDPLDMAPVPEEIRPVVAEINDLFARLDRALRAQRDFVADAAHQLRTPVAGLLAQVEAAERAAAARPLAAGELAGVAATARRLSRLVAQLLALARAEPGAPLPMEDLDLAEVVREGAEEWLPRAFAHDVDIQFDLARTPLTGSRVALREMLANLVDNAMRHGGPGGRIRIGCHPADGKARIVVEDAGPGIAPGDRERVLERFCRLPGAHPDGSGLGLAIVRAVVARHGGDIRLGESALGGLAVDIRLPAPAP